MATGMHAAGRHNRDINRTKLGSVIDIRRRHADLFCSTSLDGGCTSAFVFPETRRSSPVDRTDSLVFSRSTPVPREVHKGPSSSSVRKASPASYYTLQDRMQKAMGGQTPQRSQRSQHYNLQGMLDRASINRQSHL